MTRKQLVIAISVATVIVPLLLFLYANNSSDNGKLTRNTSQPVAQANPSQGSHEGRLFAKDGLQVEVTIYEKGVPPQFRVYVSNLQSKQVRLETVNLVIELHRLDRTDIIHFRPAGDYLLGDKTVEEPHSFDAKVIMAWNGQTYRWQFSSIEARAKIPKEAAKDAGIVVKTAGPVTLKNVLTLPGEVRLNEKKIVNITPMLDGVVKEVRANLGDRVKAGQTLAILYSRELADAKSLYLVAKKDYGAARIGLDRKKTIYENTLKLIKILKTEKNLNNLEPRLKGMTLGDSRAKLIPAYMKLKRSKAAYLREKGLFEKKISPESDYLQALEGYKSAEAIYTAMIDTIAHQSRHIFRKKQKITEIAELKVDTTTQKLLTLGLPPSEIQDLANFEEMSNLFTKESAFEQDMEKKFTQYTLKTPINGTIIEKYITVGEVVKKNQKVYLIADLANVWINITIPAKDLKSVKPGQIVTVKSEQLGLESRGKLTYMGSIVNQTTRSITGRAVIPNPQGNWRPGLFVSVELVEEERTVPVAVPVEAIQSMRGWSVVFVKYGDLYEARPLQLGESDGQWVEVLHGLSPGQEYATENSFTIKAEIGKASASHDH